MDISKKITILQAERRGENIQKLDWGECGYKKVWINCSIADEIEGEFRVEPDPRVHWCNERNGFLGEVTWPTEKEAASAVGIEGARQIKFIEAIE